MGPLSGNSAASPYQCALPFVTTAPFARSSQKPPPFGVENPLTADVGHELAAAPEGEPTPKTSTPTATVIVAITANVRRIAAPFCRLYRCKGAQNRARRD